MHKIEDQMPVPERTVAFRLEPGEAPDQQDRGKPQSTFRPQLVRVRFRGSPLELVAVHVSGPRMTIKGQLHANQFGWWGWVSTIHSCWPPEDAPDCAVLAVRMATGQQVTSVQGGA